MRLIIVLEGSTVAHCPSASLSVDTRNGKTYKDPVCPLARLLVKAGLPPETIVQVIRDGNPVFRRDRQLAAWASEDYVDNQKEVARRVKFSEWGGHLSASEHLEAAE